VQCAVDDAGYISGISFNGGDDWFFQPIGSQRAALLGSYTSDVKALNVPTTSAGVIKAWVGSNLEGTRVSSLQLIVEGERTPWVCGSARTDRWRYYVGAADRPGWSSHAVPVLCGIGGTVAKGDRGEAAGTLASLNAFSFSSEATGQGAWATWRHLCAKAAAIIGCGSDCPFQGGERRPCRRQWRKFIERQRNYK
jgi:hypothetical protein